MEPPVDVSDGQDLTSLIEHRAAATPDLVGFIDECGAAVSFDEFGLRVRQLANSLAAQGVGAGTRVSWQLPTSLAAMVLAGALASLNAVQNPILPMYRTRELSFITRQVRPDVFISKKHWSGGFDYSSMVAGVLADVDCGTELWLLDGGVIQDTGRAPVGEGEPQASVRWIFFTSGTTSEPKGVLHTDASLLAGPSAMVDAFGVTADDRFPVVFPFTHVGGIQMLVLQMLTGCSAVVIDHFDLASTLEALSSAGVTLLAGGTPLAVLFLAEQRRQPQDPLLPDLRAVVTGAAPKPPDLHRALRDELGGLGALSCYGLTEAPMSVLSRLEDSEICLSTAEGRPIPSCEVKIVSEDGSVCMPTVTGELCVRGASLCTGYLDEALNGDAFDSDGYFHTGDIGVIDLDGYVHIVGRLKDVIIRKGEKISAAEIEGVLVAMSELDEAAVVGVPDPEAGERCCVVLEDNGGRSTTLDEIVRHCSSVGLARHKLPEQIHVVDHFPRNASGKIDKTILKQLVIAEMAAADG